MNKNSVRKKLGFSLMELLLTITILIILSLVSGPIYRSHAYKAKLGEGYALLGTIRSAQQTYFGEYGNYLSRGNTISSKNSIGRAGTANEEILGIDARANKYYTWFNICWTTGGDSKKHAFTASVYGNGAPHLYLMFNNTRPPKVDSGDINEVIAANAD